MARKLIFAPLLGLLMVASAAIGESPAKDRSSWYGTIAHEFFGTVVTGLPRAISYAVSVLRSKGPLETFVENKQNLSTTVISWPLSNDKALAYKLVDSEEARAVEVPVLKVFYREPGTGEFKQGYEVDPFACFRKEWELAKQEELLFDRHLQTLWSSFRHWITASDVSAWKNLAMTSRVLGLSVLAGALGCAGYAMKTSIFDADEDSERQKGAKA